MASNPHVQNRNKHYDLALKRQLISLDRKCEQSLSTIKKTEQAIRHESKKIAICSRQKSAIRPHEIRMGENQPPVVNQQPVINQKKRTYSNDYSNENVRSSPMNDIKNKQYQYAEKTSPYATKFLRLCTNAHRLPPVVKSHIPPLKQQRLNKDTHWTSSYQASTKDGESVSDIISLLNEQLSKRSVVDMTNMDEQVHSFIEQLPTYEGIQQGFDNFGPSSRHSIPAAVAMR
ncbi:unnamed protein product [Adineta steineri]|uniref:Uncharacterized protein n=1 Tax=Adineta steineri TaxID=433720 RepID=A0A813SUA1_9BILA|nr:unnamed protein product [Adineta steineri]